MIKELSGCVLGTHRVIKPERALPQPALKINNDMSVIYDNEIVVNVDVLNVDSASFTQIKKEFNADKAKMAEHILTIVNERGKLQNPVTGSGGMFIGRVEHIGSKLANKVNIKQGDKIASLVSLSLTPLKIDEIIDVNLANEQVQIKGQALLFESGIYVKLPDDIPERLALAILDVAGAPAQTERLVKEKNTVVIIGAGGKSGLLCSYIAKKLVGNLGKVIGIEYNDKGVDILEKLNVCTHILKLDATNAVECYNQISKLTKNNMADIVINCVNINDTEMSSILACKNRGIVYFFSMATSFTKAALGAEGVGKDIDMLVGNGYAKGHAETVLNILREAPHIRAFYEKVYAI